MEEKAAIIGVGVVDLAKAMVEITMRDVELVSEVHPYIARPEFTDLRTKKKRECTYHEYTERKHKDDLGSIVKIDWACRHCGRVL